MSGVVIGGKFVPTVFGLPITDTCQCGHKPEEHTPLDESVFPPPPTPCTRCSCRRFLWKQRDWTLKERAELQRTGQR